MSARRPLVRRFWLSDWSLSALLALLLFNAFVLGPLALSQAAPEWLSPIVHSLFLLMGIATVLWSRAGTTIVGVLALASCVVRIREPVGESPERYGKDPGNSAPQPTQGNRGRSSP